MELRQIRYFQAVVQTGSFYKAAEQCYVSQSAVSQQIRLLEEELGLSLLERHNRTFSLTPAGKKFYEKSLIVTSDVDQLILETKRTAGEGNELRIGCSLNFPASVFAEAVGLFANAFPQIHLRPVFGNHETLHHMIRTQELDLIINDQRRMFSDAYENRILAESEVWILLSKSSPLANLKEIEVQALQNIPCVLIASPDQFKNEKLYYEDYLHLSGEFLAAKDRKEAELTILQEHAYLPLDVFSHTEETGTSLAILPLVINGRRIHRNFCAFNQLDIKTGGMEEFVSILKKVLTKKENRE